jgi:hypothetical protein
LATKLRIKPLYLCKNQDKIVNYNNLYFSGHATIQMFKRRILVEDVTAVIQTGNVIKEYPDDKPYPSFLILGFVNDRPLHIVASTDELDNCYIITAYEPDEAIWNNDFNTKK